MKKILKLLFPIILLPTITACQDKTHSIIAISPVNTEYGFIEASVDQVANLIESKQHFILETYTTTCSSCQELEPILKEYVTKNNKAIYRLKANSVDIEVLNEKLLDKYPNIFTERTVPSIKFIKNGTLTYNVNSNKFGTYSGLSKILNKHFLKSSIYIADNIEDYESFASSNLNHLIYSYDLNEKGSLDFANQYLINQDFTKAKKTLILINKVSFADKFANFCTKYTEGNEKFFAAIKDKKVIKTIDYSSADGNQIDEVISSL